jgi:pimeloyl-ACP methyl ester carboxylesterase
VTTQTGIENQAHVTAKTQYVEVNGRTFAYRRFGSEDGTPLLFLQHFRGNMDSWDPAVTDGLAAGRPVVLFDNAGVGATTGETPDRVETHAEDAAAFAAATGMTRYDVLGFSIGGYVAQPLALRHQQAVRRVVLVGTKPRAGDDRERHPDVNRIATQNELLQKEDLLSLFFSPSAAGQAAGEQYWRRRSERTVDRDKETSRQTMQAQAAAIADWAQSHGEPYSELASMTQPVLVINGIRDVMVPTGNSYILARHIPNAQLIIYPDAGHGSLFQYPRLFVDHVARFLDTEVPFE